MTVLMPSPADPCGHPLPRDLRCTPGTASAPYEHASVGLEGVAAGVSSPDQQAPRLYEHYRAQAEGRVSSVASAAGSVAVSPQSADGAWLIVLEGEHDLSTAALLERATIGLWQRCTLAVVDVSGAAFIDTTVVNWLMHARRMLEASRGGALAIVEGPPASSAARLLRLVGLSEVVACFPTREDALSRTLGLARSPLTHSTSAIRDFRHS